MPISRIKTDGIQDDAVTSAKIGVDVIVADDLAANSVTVSEITNGAVTSAKLDTNIAIAGNLLVGSSSAVGNANANDLELTNSGGSGVVGMTFNVNSGSANTGNIYWRSNAANNNIQIVGDPITNYLAFATSGTEKLRINSSGNVGIGGAPNNWGGMGKTLELIGSYDVQLAIHANSDSLSDGARIGEVAFLAGSTNTLPNVATIVGRVAETDEAKGFLTFHCRDTDTAGLPQERMRIDNSGNVGIGTSSLNSRFEINSAQSATSRIRLKLNDSAYCYFGGYSGIVGSGNADDVALYAWTGKQLMLGTNATERMRIDSSGRVSIGGVQTSAGAKLSVISDSVITSGSNTTDEGIVMIPSASLSSNQYAPWISWTGYSPSSATQRGRAGIGALSTNNASGLELIFATRNAADGSVLSPADEKMRLTTGGQLCLNKTSDSFNDSVGISVNGAAGLIRVERNNDPSLQLNRMNANGEIVQFFRGAGNKVGNITGNTSSVSYNTSSDYRLKENVEYDFDATTRLKQLKPARFNFIADADTTVDGFLAHEVQDIIPEAISGTKDAVENIGTITDQDNNVIEENVKEPSELPEGQTWTQTGTQPVYQGIDQSKLVPLLVKTIQELEARITALESN